jgi:toxin secretion/phage lysis holin
LNELQISAIAKTLTASVGAFFGYVLGEWTIMMQVLLYMAIADYLTGLIAGYKEKSLASKVGFKGIAKKVVIFVLIGVGYQLDQLFGHGSTIQDMIMFFYIGNELLSLIENAGRIGVPVPSALKEAVAILRAKSGEKEEPTTTKKGDDI